MNITISPISGITSKEKYPYLGIAHATGQVVLFTGRDTGTLLIVGSSRCFVGEHCECWAESNFSRLDAEIRITLSND
jgi:hypothetical protein